MKCLLFFTLVSSGQLVKEALTNESKVGEAIKPYVERNMLVPDNLMIKILDERLAQLDCASRGWVLRGFPRTREQAENLSKIGHEPNRYSPRNFSINDIEVIRNARSLNGLSCQVHWTQALVFLISRVWVRVPVLTLVSLSKTLNHLLLFTSDGTLSRWSSTSHHL